MMVDRNNESNSCELLVNPEIQKLQALLLKK